MAAQISIRPITVSQSDQLSSQLSSFLSKEQGHGLMVSLQGSIGSVEPREHLSLPLPKDVYQRADMERLRHAYPEVDFSRLASVTAIDTTLPGSAGLAIYLAETNSRSVELVFNRIPLTVQPGDSLASVQEEFLNQFHLVTREKDLTEIVTMDTKELQSSYMISLDDCLRNAIAIAHIHDKPVQFIYYDTSAGEILSEFVSKDDCFEDIMRQVDPRLRRNF